MIDSWHSYPSVYALGHKVLTELFLDPVVIEEKVDGSQFSLGLFSGDYRCRSKGKELVLDAPEKMFQTAVTVARSLPLHEGWTYRCEYLQKPHHNALAYDRVPKQHLMLFDINDGYESYLSPEAVAEEADRLGLEMVPVLFQGRVSSPEMLVKFLDTPSVLGGSPVEGIVCKSSTRFGPDKKALMGKLVSERFKEVHAAEWKRANPTSGDIMDQLIDRYRTPARWHKAVQHLIERGACEHSPRDIGALIVEVGEDVRRECENEIKDMVFAWAWPKLRRALTAGLPEWYKNHLLLSQFHQEEDTTTVSCCTVGQRPRRP